MCVAKLKDINIEIIRKKHNLKQKKIQKKIQKKQRTETELKRTGNSLQLTKTQIYECHECNKIFKTNKILKQHIKCYCKIKQEQNKQNKLLKNENETLKKQNQENKNEKDFFQKQIKEMKNQIEILLEKVGNNIIINNIQLNNYGNENVKHITSKILKQLIETPSKSIPKLIKQIHFNEDFPENKNVRITNRKLPYAEVFKDNKWELRNKSEVVNNMFMTKSKILDDEFKEIKDTLPNKINSRYDTFSHDKMWDSYTRNKVLKNVEIAILNGS